MAKMQLILVGVFFVLSIGRVGASCFSTIYSFGDSLTDTGNEIISNPLVYHQFNTLPYGEKYFGKPTGRCSNGRLLIDFLAASLDLPFLPPYLKVGRMPFSSRSTGVNFAIAGCTALDSSFLHSMGVVTTTPLSLSAQINWFTNLKNDTCKQNPGCQDHFSKALYFFGEIGANDYIDSTALYKPLSQIQGFTSPIIAQIQTSLEALIQQGAENIIVQGIPPLGCSPLILTLQQNSTDFDENGCLQSYNQISQNHNSLLQIAIEQLNDKYSTANIVYSDYYNIALDILKNAAKNGFEETFETCCGSGGGKYNFNILGMCGTSNNVKACSDPSKFVNWDGIHLTEAAYQIGSDSISNLVQKMC
ncbi:hypothetical protein SUGI_1114490 [Cryptomeria japonica]|uniref:GDSL esterase/lipase At1g28600 n=1 Tax=Cryptomeria japonica TaxID=3369 RepID=UPI002414AD00|nr:GDSL esterase/lipase At1g28600 [Cryptomeria japonica]GLJ52398.1 hypothetical protein SUGI_1114490 [Cryptomeria japonica]